MAEEENMECDNDCEYEPFDTKKEKYIEQDLMDQYDNHLLMTIRHRKACPSQVKSKLKKVYRLECKHLAQKKYVKSEENGGTEGDGACQGDSLNQAAIEERLKDTGAKCKEITVKCKDILSKTREVAKAVELNRKYKNSVSYHMLSETPPTTPDTMDTDTPCFTETHLNRCVVRKLDV